MKKKSKITKKNVSKEKYVTKSRFDLTVEHFDKKLEQVDERFDKIDKRFEQVDERFDKIDKRFEQVDERFDKIEADIANIKYDIVEMKEDISIIKEGQSKMLDLLDGYVKSNEDMKEEFYIMKWEIREIKRVIEEKLGVKIQVMG